MQGERVEVAVSPPYTIEVVEGGLDGLGEALAERLPPGRCFLVTNPVVGALYAEPALASLRAAGFAPELLEVPDGEAHKDLDTWRALVESLLDRGIDRRTPVLALGGGVTGDVVGFAAATVLRGVPFVQVPTSLLAMVDASVGGKTGVDTRHGKNLVGAFHQPRLVYAAVGTLASLPAEEYRSGLGESLKHGLIRDAALFEWMLGEARAIQERVPSALVRLVAWNCRVKAAVVAADERESGLRSILNFGHTVGHALEAALGYGRLRHGEAVVLGMVAEARYAEARGWAPPGLAGRIVAAARALGLPTRAPGRAGSLRGRMLALARMDKKTARGTLALVVPVKLGEVRLERVPVDELPALLDALPVSKESP